MLGVFGCARATDGVVGLESLAGWSAMNLSVSGFCLATEVRNSRSSFVDPLLLSAPPWMVPVRWINYSVRCGPCLCLLFYPDSSGSDDGCEFTDPNWSCQRVFIRPFLSNGDFHWPILTCTARHCWKCAYLTGRHSAVKLRRHSLRTPLFFKLSDVEWCCFL